MYYDIKHLHMLCAALSISGFVLQGVWMMTNHPLLNHRVTRRLPHVVDTVFLFSGVTLAVMSAQYPFAAPWLTAKVLALVAYILLGAVALRRGPTKRIRVVAFVLALLTFAWIVSVALTKQPGGYLTLFGLL